MAEHYASAPTVAVVIHRFFTPASQLLHPERPLAREPALQMADRIESDATIRVDDLEITPGEGLVKPAAGC